MHPGKSPYISFSTSSFGELGSGHTHGFEAAQQNTEHHESHIVLGKPNPQSADTKGQCEDGQPSRCSKFLKGNVAGEFKYHVANIKDKDFPTCQQLWSSRVLLNLLATE